ncbi:MAG: ATP-dependent DNA helicase RecG [Chitinophagales bacterium]|nr:ATP-dependent DNA helicase RecG [Chitinophagales bacterium]
MAYTPTLLSSPIEYLKTVGPQRADLLKKELNIFTFGDLLHHFPFRYVDRTSFYKIGQITQQTPHVQIVGQVMEKNIIGERQSKRLIAYLKDDTGEIELVWFRALRWVEKSIETGKKYIVFGKPNFYRGSYSLVHPEVTAFEQDRPDTEGRLQPIYSSTEKLKAASLDSRGIEKLTNTLFDSISENDLPENLPQSISARLHLPRRFAAFVQIHMPQDLASLEKARKRVKFEELFLSQIRILQRKTVRKKDSAGFLFPRLDPLFNEFYREKLPFQLTAAQKKVIREIRTDLISGKQMNRLLQGDVGSGKTIVSLLIMLMAIDNGFQTAMMVPTEILAQQHYRSLSEITCSLNIKISLLTAHVKGSERNSVLTELKSGAVHLIIGTHSLIQEQVIFNNLGLIVIDEQHRFGVEQRAQLWTKNTQPPHVLVMTATPIPRTLAMTIYGDLDVSTIDELPPGRKPVNTVHRYDSARLRVFGFMKEQINAGRQVYVVYPLIEESEKQDYKFLIDGYESITRAFPLPEFAVSIVHGKMKTDARDYEMQRFIKKETQIMVSTTVIEVGVDVSNASVMIIESAERFGLSQLHQLRGRVGRGADQAYCILMTGNKLSAEARLRMKIMTATNDGFRIAEEDLKVRGPGNLEGIQQSGMAPLLLADLVHDQKILQVARSEAEKILKKDPLLQSTENATISSYLKSISKKERRWSSIS